MSCILPAARPTSGAQGRLVCAMWYLCFPLILVGHSLRIYVLPCLLSYAIGACGKCWLAVGSKLCCCFGSCGCCRRMGCCVCFKYEDGAFQACADSLGPIETEAAKEAEWKRGGEIFLSGRGGEQGEGQQAQLFAGEIEPNDIGQGQLGDCWLLTAFVCLAEFPGAIQSVFLTNEFNPRGRYSLRLFNGATRAFEELVIDDYIPVARGTSEPLFAKPHGRELWVLLLEKAFAKFLGSYHKLDGGFSLWGLQALTGDEVSNWRLEQDGSWGEYEIRYVDGLQEIGFYKRLVDGGSGHSKTNGSTEFFDKLAAWDSEECVIAASTSGTDEGESTAQQGLVQGHAYAVTTVRHVGKHKMLRLRNPWGSFEWTGDWSDESPLWKKHSDVRRACDGGEQADDGFFWMSFGDFCAHFKSVDVCHRSRGIADVRLDVHEDKGCKGPLLGCVTGCCGYFIKCRGCCALCCPTDHAVLSAQATKQGDKQASYAKLDINDSVEVSKAPTGLQDSMDVEP